jgi:hypothetical protein
MEMLDEVVGAKAQLSGTEFLFLVGVSLAAGVSPLVCAEKVVEVRRSSDLENASLQCWLKFSKRTN